jgi:hypothetical protein
MKVVRLSALSTGRLYPFTVFPEVSTQPRFSAIPLNGVDEAELLILIT